MEINIPRNLAGPEAQGGAGGALMQIGENISQAGNSAGAMLDNIQANYDYNSFVDITSALEPELEQNFLESTQKDNGSNPKAFEEFQASQQKIIDRSTSKAGNINGRVSDAVKRHSLVRSQDYAVKARRAFTVNMLKHSIEVDEDQAHLSLNAALSRGGNPYENLKGAIEENKAKIFSRQGLYGDNTQKVYDGAMSKALLSTLDLSLKDPERSRQVVTMMKDPKVKEEIFGYLTPEGQSHVQGLLKAMNGEVTMRDGMTIGTEIFKADKTGSLESMTDAVRAKGVDADVEKAAVTQIKELYSERRTDEVKRANDAKDKVNQILNPIALKRNGLNRVSDLSPEQWSELERDNPEYAKQLQDSMRRELDYEIRQRKQDAALAKQERMLAQSENEQNILLDPELRTRDLRSDLATGKISATQFNRLSKIQSGMDPMKSNSVKAALSRINTGGALAAALGGLDKNEEANWKLKYSELIKVFAENNIDDPNFDAKLTDFMEKHVFSDMATSWFATDTADRIDKYNTALKAADPMRNDAIAILRANKKPVTEANIRHIVNKMKGRK